jgi:hypothetical protein
VTRARASARNPTKLIPRDVEPAAAVQISFRFTGVQKQGRT